VTTQTGSGPIVVEKNTTSTISLAATPLSPLGSQVTVSEMHFEWKGRAKRTFANDVGGPFFSQKSRVVLDNPDNIRVSGTEVVGSLVRKAVYNGPGFAIAPNAVPIPSVTLSDLRPWGTTAIARCKPTNSVADLSNFLAELYSEGLPKLFGSTLWKENVHLARNSGEEYLNTEFGWKPMISDVRDISHAVTHARDVLEAYERGSGHVVRRRYAFPVEQTVSESSEGIRDSYECLNGGASSAIRDPLKTGTETRRVHRTWKQIWFSGAFTYHLPSGYRSRNALISAGIKAKTLLGLDLTPEVVWNAAPWSWAIDWFSNAGDVISNISDWATDGLVLKYGYVMEHSFVTDWYYQVKPTNFRQSGVYVSPVTAYVETKRREVATPFGFEATWSGMSPRQVAIATALGLTRRW
jgi:hypothetical protein